MEEKGNNMWKICTFISSIIIVILAGYIIATNVNVKKADNNKPIDVNSTNIASNTTNVDSTEDDGLYRDIRIDEDLSLDGRIENLENVRWNNARIRQDAEKMEVSIMINNESQKEKVAARTLTVTLFDKSGKVIGTKDTQMKEIEANYGYTDLEMIFDIKEVTLVYNIKIVAK